MAPLIAQLQEHQLGMPIVGHLPGVSSPPGNLMQPSAIFEYDFGDEGDLFKAPEPITEETLLAIDPMSAGVSIVAGGDDVIINTIKVAEAIQNEMQSNPLLSEVFYECKKDLLEKCAISELVLDPSPLPIPSAEDLCWDSGRVAAEASLNKSFSAGSLDSREWVSCAGRPNFLEFQGLDFEAAYGMRRAYSEGDIEKLENTAASFGGTNDARSSLEQLVAMGEFKSEDRRQKLSRYMKKKTKRNFGRKIKYACRKALADCQPRVRGRFAKIEECGSYKQKTKK
ncbi:putative zinc finger protein CONSTANS-LIKE 11 [Platanthera zijinensis]|uniref:Zinc finger protein CONSTANS-LIKE 11 n=1 Tax=Platanthera zijinensis TaxID=2320716 RepID=A0AAP0GBQ0_9ASPA